MPVILKENGYSLIELVLVLLIIGIIVSIAMKSMSTGTDTSRIEETKRELERLEYAIVGDPAVVSGGVRTDYGYVGDIGALPSDLDALITNPGGYLTWDGPYLTDDFSTDGSSTKYKIDSWGQAYVYSAGTTIMSTGGSRPITRKIANSNADLLFNSVRVVIVDVNGTPPGAAFRDSVELALTYPDGSGSIITGTAVPRADGLSEFDSVPIGAHLLQTIYLPTGDTIARRVNIDPGHDYYTEIKLNQDFW